MMNKWIKKEVIKMLEEKNSILLRLLNPPHDIVIPFICQQCGRCCKEIGTCWNDRDIGDAIEYLKISVEDFINTYLGHVTKEDDDKLTYRIDESKRIPCGLLKDNKCSIYPARPMGCRLYPISTDFGTKNVDCPAWERVIVIMKKLRRGIPGYLSYAGGPKYRAPTLKKWARILNKYHQTNPTDEERELFIKYNDNKMRR